MYNKEHHLHLLAFVGLIYSTKQEQFDYYYKIATGRKLKHRTKKRDRKRNDNTYFLDLAVSKSNHRF